MKLRSKSLVLFGSIPLISYFLVAYFSAEAFGQATLETVPEGIVPDEVGREQARGCEDFPTLFGHRLWNHGQSDNPHLQLRRNTSSLSDDQFNDAAESACVPPNWRLELYGEEDYNVLLGTIDGVNADRGTARYYNFPEASDLSGQISSVKVFRYESHDRLWISCEATRHCRF